PSLPLASHSDNVHLLGSLATNETGAQATLTPFSSSSILPSSGSMTAAPPRSGYAVAARKETSQSLSRLAPKLEETLDEIAADISQAGSNGFGAKWSA